MSVRIIISLLTIMMSNILLGQADNNALISLEFTNTPANIIFREIQKQTGMVFSYSEFQDNQEMDIQVAKVALSELLPILESTLNVHITVKDKYLIVKPVKEIRYKALSINGTITDPNSMEPISDASIFVKKLKILVNSGKDGRFAFNLPSDAKQVKINVAKENYIDTSLVIIASRSQSVHIKMRSFPRQRISRFDSLSKKDLQVGSITDDRTVATPEIVKLSYNDNFWNKMKLKNVDLVNINDTIFNSFSVSLIPPISTNKLLSFHTRNTISLNIIGGNSKGLNGVEIGGVYNYDHGDVYGLQVAGVVNAVSENVIGTQISGVMNTVKGKVKGVQIAGVLNHNDSITEGIQISGVYQNTKMLRGLQIAGLYNSAIKTTGGQISGLINRVDSASTFVQIAGLYNRAANIKGVQISGLVNSCDTLTGLQIGIYNHADYVKKGLAIGLINYVKNGYHKLEFSYNELGTSSIGFRSGWAPLHMHYFGGINLVNKDLRFLQAGMGIASSLSLSKTINFEVDANIRNAHDIDDFSTWDFNMHNQLMLGLSWQPFKKIGIRTGITFNHFWYNNKGDINNHVVSLIDNPVYEKGGIDRSHKMWIGWHVGLVLF